MQYLSVFLSCTFMVFGFACQSDPDPKKIIAEAIAAHGGDGYDGKHISFSFRDRHYDVRLHGGQFTYERAWEDSLGSIHDVLDNQGFTRKIDGEEVVLSAKDEQRYADALNSVVYFALLPQPLTDPAVNATYLGADTVKSKPYHKVQVTFDQQGGGTDFDDVFVYWFHQNERTMDYLAYSFHVNGGGTRFREAYNGREINGIRFADYINYTDTLHQFSLEEYDTQFTNDQVQELSRIDLENVAVIDELKN
ncbi:DUF6503 family protein [Tunicatimonas pelagia]|uniref:DUF6503 family protein n=1 Tax=Tunicatimonas pelagia TaxID=931531 RepID=UPI002665C5F0|nr:DUF6503 family protein [Tunicatimonas pelagia]WKN40420.1 hypothetical protein P0M28_15355 [Tunicatimonas pelagia]